jgi:hypothetical protein
VSDLVGFDRLDQIIGFKIASYSYITIEMEGEHMLELLKAIKEMMDTNQAKVDADQEERKAKADADQEMLAEIEKELNLAKQK